MLRSLLLASCFSAVVLFAGRASGAVIYVDPIALSPQHDGVSWKTAFLHIQDALTSASAGDEVWVADGLYKENLVLGPGVALYGGFSGDETYRDQRVWNTHSTVLDGTQKTGVVVTAMNAGDVVDGFLIRNGVGGVSAGGTAAIRHNIITRNARRDGAGILCYGDGVTITNNVITGNQATDYGGGIDAEAVGVIANNLIVNNMLTDMGGGGGGIYVGAVPALIVNNTIVSNFGFGGGIFASTGTRVANNIVAFNSSGISTPDDHGVLDVEYNDVFGNSDCDYLIVTDATGLNGNVSVDPQFGDRPQLGYHLSAASPCVDAGNDALVLNGEPDLDERPRIHGAHVDLGAYETIPLTLYSMSDATHALAIVGGLESSNYRDSDRLDTGIQDEKVTLTDVVRIVRALAGNAAGN